MNITGKVYCGRSYGTIEFVMTVMYSMPLSTFVALHPASRRHLVATVLLALQCHTQNPAVVGNSCGNQYKKGNILGDKIGTYLLFSHNTDCFGIIINLRSTWLKFDFQKLLMRQ